MRAFSQTPKISPAPRPTMSEDTAGIFFAMVLYVAVIFGIRAYNQSSHDTVAAPTTQNTVQIETPPSSTAEYSLYTKD
ncbi:MAG: hypothetical protein R3D00_09660 [Bacteroidia bacterium]